MSKYIDGTSVDLASFSGDDILVVVEQSGQRDTYATINQLRALLDTLPIVGGTANGVLYLNGSKVVTSGSALTFDGTTLATTGLVSATGGAFSGNVNPASGSSVEITYVSGVGYITSYNRTSSAWTDLYFRAGANTIWSASGSEAMRLTSTGLGIGTSSPGAKLQVAWSSDQLKFTNPSAGFKQIGASYTGYVSGNDYAAIILGTDGSSGGKIQFSVTPSSGSLTTAATLDQNGNLGLGVTPSAWLSSFKALQVGTAAVSQIANRAYLTANWFSNGSGTDTYIATDFATMYRQQNGGHEWLTAPSGTAGNAISFSQVMTLDASGNLGVGTTSPNSYGSTTTFTINGTTYSEIDFEVGGTLQAYINGISGGLEINADGSRVIVLRTNGTERARITSGGSLVVGTAALATSATDGFLYVPTCAGTPTGTPTTQTGTAPIVVDTTNNKLYFYSGGQWRDAGP